MAGPRPGTTEGPDEGRDVFLNNNIWLATAFALTLVATAFALLFLLAWLEPRPREQSRSEPVAPLKSVGRVDVANR